MANTAILLLLPWLIWLTWRTMTTMTTQRRWPSNAEYYRTEALHNARQIRDVARTIRQADERRSRDGIVAVACLIESLATQIELSMTMAKVGRE